MPTMKTNEEDQGSNTVMADDQNESKTKFIESLPSVESWPSLDEVEEIFDYRFRDKSLLEEAFMHASIPGTSISYERLEYVGDSVLSLLIAKEQYFLYPELPPGSLTKLRAVNVDTEKLARVALKHGLHKYLRHKKPVLQDQIEEFSKTVADYPLHSNGLINAPKDLADIVESSIGAVFIDSNSSLDIVWKVFKKLLEPIISPNTIGKHPMSELYELCQKHGWKLEFVPDLSRRVIEVFVENELMGSAAYDLKMKKDIAQNRAAKNTLKTIESILGDITNDDDHLATFSMLSLKKKH